MKQFFKDAKGHLMTGIVLMAFMYFMLYILPERNTEAKCEAESQQRVYNRLTIIILL